MKSIAKTLLVPLLLGFAFSASAAISGSERQEVEKIVEEYLVSHPEVVIKAIHVWQQKQQAAEEALRKETMARLREDAAKGGSPVWGNPAGSVTVVEFSDYNCPYCKRSFPLLSKMVREDGDIRVVMKELPVLGPGSEYAARAALAAQRQGKYQAFHEAMMAHQGRVAQQQVDQVARQVGLDPDRMKKDMESDEVSLELQKNRIWAERLGITGTPAFVIGEELVPGAIDGRTMKKLVEAARAGGK